MKSKQPKREVIKLKCPKCGKIITCQSTPIDGWYMEQLMHMREKHDFNQ